MKTLINCIGALTLALALFSCSASKQMAQTEPMQETMRNLEGDRVEQETTKVSGIAMGEALSEDGTSIMQMPYKWFSAEAKADNKQVALEMAQAEAYTTISRVMDNIVDSKIQQATLGNNGKVQQALRSHWKQVSQTILKSCEPFGDVVTQYNKKDQMYNVLAKVAIRGDRFNKIMSEATAYKPSNLNATEMKSFVETNRSIFETAKQ